MEHTTRSCDFLVKRRGAKAAPHGIPVEDNQSTVFVINGTEYTADLCQEHRHVLVESVQEFIDIARTAKPSTVARTVNGRGRLVHRSGPVAFTSKDVRLWLQEQGREVPASGRISKDLIKQYEDAHVPTR